MKALFLDRDGVINIDKGYVSQIGDFEFISTVFETLRTARRCGFEIFIVTNQSGIARGFYSEETYQRLMAWVVKELQKEKIPIRAVYHCPYHPEGIVPEYVKESELRKPNPGMLFLASEEHGVDLAKSILVGDKETDVLAGIRAGVARTVLISSKLKVSTQADFVVESIAQLEGILEQGH